MSWCDNRQPNILVNCNTFTMVGTVALPIYNSHRIAWLCLESLCRQIRPEGSWELIVYEEIHVRQLGEGYIRGYEERLKDAGCERIVYLTSDYKVPLSEKWVEIAKTANSDYFCLCAADNYYQPWMLCDIERAITEADWCILTRGYFYDFHMDKVILYHYNSVIGLQMAVRTELIKQFPIEERNKGVDSWVFSKISELKGIGKTSIYMDGTEHFERMLCTNGLNNISKERYKSFVDPHPPFYDTGKTLAEIVPDDIYERLVALRKTLMMEFVSDDMAK